jgi:DNA-binding SARP family transcriptional activator
MSASETLLARIPPIVFSGDQYALNPRLAIHLDVEEFRGRLAEARAMEAQGDLDAACDAYWLAQESYRGEFLPEDRYEDWVSQERDSLRAEHLTVLSRLVKLHLRARAYQEAIHFGRVLLEIDNTREDVHRDLMRCFSRLGERTEALKQYRQCVDALKSELELVPEPASQLLHARLVRGEVL